MFQSIANDFRYAWNRPNSGLQRLIMVNVIVFLVINILWLFSSDALFAEIIRFIALPVDLKETIWKPWTVVSSFFAHHGFSHILWNMLFLYWFGMLIRDYLGNDKLISLYFLGGLAGTIGVLVLFNLVPSFAARAEGIALGASAAVFAISVAAATLMPDHAFHLIFIGPVKIKYIVAIHVFFAVIGLKGNNVGGEVAHLSGAFVGYLYVRQLQQGNDMGAWVIRTLSFFQSFFVRQPKIKVSYKKNTSSGRRSATQSRSTRGTSNAKNASQEEIDAILDKISEKGYESLTKEEKQKLFNASKK
ncbi:MAG: rhomboid family intramembrane serine protease [Bacteroidota bacterium]